MIYYRKDYRLLSVTDYVGFASDERRYHYTCARREGLQKEALFYGRAPYITNMLCTPINTTLGVWRPGWNENQLTSKRFGPGRKTMYLM